MGSVVLPHLETGWHVDQAILSEEERLVVIRFGRDWNPDCMRQDEVLYRIADRVKNFAVIYRQWLSCIKIQTSASLLMIYSLRSRQSSRFQPNVRAVRSYDSHVLLPEQAYDVRLWHGQQQ